MTATYTPAEVLEMVRSQRPDSNPVAVSHDDMAAFCDGEPWFVFFDSEDAAPDRIVLPRKD